MEKITMLLTNEFLPDMRVYKEAVYLLRRGYQIEILCWQRDASLPLPEREVIDGISVKRFVIPSVAGSGKKQIPAFITYIQECRKHLKTHPCDYLHCHDIDGAITGYLSRQDKTPMVFDMHEFYEKGSNAKRTLWRKLTIFLLKKSIAGIYVSSAYLCEEYSCVYDRLFSLRNYPDGNLLQALKKEPCDTFRIGYHGAVRSQIPEFTALFDAVKDMPDVRVDINGEGPDNATLAELEKHYTNVYVHGAFNGTKHLTTLYTQTDVLFCGYDPSCLNYQGDTEAVKFYEAIFTGTPMIMTEDIGMGEKVRKHGFGIACDTRSPQDIRQAIIKLKSDHAFWTQCSDNEKEQAHRYDWNEAVKVLDKIYV